MLCIGKKRGIKKCGFESESRSRRNVMVCDTKATKVRLIRDEAK